MRKFVGEPLTRNQVKELFFVIHNGITEEERNNAKWIIAYSYEKPLYYECIDVLKLLRKKIDEYELNGIVDEWLNVLFEKAETYDPNHSSGATLYTYARKELKKTFFKKTNPGMTETQIRNYNKIHTAKKHYELIHKRQWIQTEDSLIELSNICGLSVKVITKTIELKQQLNKRIVSLEAPENKWSSTSLGDHIEDKRQVLEIQFENQLYRNVLNSLKGMDKIIFDTWVDMENNRLISEREGVRLLEEMNIKNIGRGTLNKYRKELQTELWSRMNDKQYYFAA